MPLPLRLLIPLVALAAAPALAQRAPQYPLRFALNEQIGDGTTPNGGTPPGWADRPPPFAETVSARGWVTGAGAIFTPVTNGEVEEAKARFTCNEATIGLYDPIRGPGLEPYGHGHNFFGNVHVGRDSSFTTLRRQPDSTCPGGPLNGSSYWMPWIYKENARAPGETLVKKYDLVTLYYLSTMVGKTFAETARIQPFVRGFQMVFGMNMDDPDEKRFAAAADAYLSKHGDLRLQRPGPNRGRWSCLNSNGSYAGSPEPGSPSQPSLANYDGSETLRCSPDEPLALSLSSYPCWDGRLSSPDGYSHMAPAMRSNVDGLEHCPVGWFRLPRVTVIFRFSHQGPADYRTWKCSSDAPAAVAAGRPMRACESTHTDYQFGWNEAWAGKWMANCLGITIDGVPGKPHNCDYGTVGPGERLISDSPRPAGGGLQVDIQQQFKGTKPGDWFVPPAGQGAAVHAGMRH